MQRFGITPSFKIDTVISLYARLIREGKLKPDNSWNKALGLTFTVQDPCQLVRKGLGDVAADDIRFTLAACVGEEYIIEMTPNRSANYCCGGGGGYLQSGYTKARHVFGRVKHEQILRTGASHVITPCHNCHSQIHDLAEIHKAPYMPLHLWTVLALSLGLLSENETRYLGEAYTTQLTPFLLPASD